MSCERCGGPTQGQDIWGKSHRYHPDCIAYLKAVQVELCEALIRVVEWMDANGYSPIDQSFGARAALAKARGGQS